MGQCGSVPDDVQRHRFSWKENKVLYGDDSGRCVIVDAAVATFPAARVLDGNCVKQITILRMDDATIAHMKQQGLRVVIGVRHYFVLAKTDNASVTLALVPIPGHYWTVRDRRVAYHEHTDLKAQVIRHMLHERPSFATLRDVANWRAALFARNGLPPDARIIAEVPKLS
tara:strand:- start:2194 stop:2703 length:510 start_codon:yes stop_codon:yes gene_type:complete